MKVCVCFIWRQLYTTIGKLNKSQHYKTHGQRYVDA